MIIIIDNSDKVNLAIKDGVKKDEKNVNSKR